MSVQVTDLSKLDVAGAVRRSLDSPLPYPISEVLPGVTVASALFWAFAALFFVIFLRWFFGDGK